MSTLVLVTGNPGNGKTLYTIQEVEKLREVTQRTVYQHGVTGLTLPWLELRDPLKWFECPIGSIIVIDEAWRFFPVRKQGHAVPDYVEHFAEHRHQGFNIYLITQHRHQLDTFVRKMVTRHIHLERKFGALKARVWQWEKEGDPSSNTEKESALVRDWSYPKSLFSVYQSAEVHTVKKDFPWRRFWWVPLVGLAAPLLLWSVWKRMHDARSMLGGGLAPAGAAEAAAPRARLGPAEFWSQRNIKPRVYQAPESAPRFDSKFEIVSRPQLSGCMQLARGVAVQCECTDQAGAVLPMSPTECVSLVRSGWFDASRHYADVKERNIASQCVQ